MMHGARRLRGRGPGLVSPPPLRGQGMTRHGATGARLAPTAMAIVTALALVAAGSRPVQAGGTVTGCTEAALDAALAGGGTVLFGCSGTILPTSTKTIASDTVIDATGSSVTMDGSRLEALYLHSADVPPMFRVLPGIRLEVIGITFVGMVNDAGEGVPIVNGGSLLVENSVFQDNTMLDVNDAGGAIINHGDAVIRDSSFRRNALAVSRVGHSAGGAIWNDGSLQIVGSHFEDNGSSGHWFGAGAVYDHEGTVTVVDSTFVGNVAGTTVHSPGAGAITTSGGWLTIDRSEFSSNEGWVGAVWSDDLPASRLVVQDSIFQGNVGFAGTLFNGPGTATIERSSFLGNNGRRLITGIAGSLLALGSSSVVNDGGAMQITDVVFDGNEGGSTFLNVAGSTRVSRAAFNDNIFDDAVPTEHPQFTGGSVLWNHGGEVLIEDSAVTGNTSTAAGTLVNFGGSLSIRRSEISHNTSVGGSAVLNRAGTTSIANSTLFENVASDPPGHAVCFRDFEPEPCSGPAWDVPGQVIDALREGYGGAIHNRAVLTLDNVTIARNEATGADAGAGLYNTETGSASVRNTIIIDNDFSEPSSDCINDGAFTETASIIGFGDCPAVLSGILPFHVRLGAPTGRPAVVPLRNGSLAIDIGNDAVCAGPSVGSVDQRGFVRPHDGDGDGIPVCDIGAFESANRPPTIVAHHPIVIVDEGETATNTGAIADPDGDPLILFSSFGSVMQTPSGGWSWSLLTLDGPSNSDRVEIEVSDLSASRIAAFDLVVNNVPPAVEIQAPSPLLSGQTLAVSGSYEDPSPTDTHSATIDFGTGLGPEQAAVGSTAPGMGNVAAERRYVEPGTYIVTLCVTDDDGGSGCASTEVQVLPLAITIDIMPGSTTNPIIVDFSGVIPVAVLSTTNFDATTLLGGVACFGSADDASARDCSEPHGRYHPERVDRDGLTDVLLHFETVETGIGLGDAEACLSGTLADGRFFLGCDVVRPSATGSAEGRFLILTSTALPPPTTTRLIDGQLVASAT